MSDEKLGAVILGAAIGALLSLWVFNFGAFGIIVGGILGALALPVLIGRRA